LPARIGARRGHERRSRAGASPLNGFGVARLLVESVCGSRREAPCAKAVPNNSIGRRIAAAPTSRTLRPIAIGIASLAQPHPAKRVAASPARRVSCECVPGSLRETSARKYRLPAGRSASPRRPSARARIKNPLHGRAIFRRMREVANCRPRFGLLGTFFRSNLVDGARGGRARKHYEITCPCHPVKRYYRAIDNRDRSNHYRCGSDRADAVVCGYRRRLYGSLGAGRPQFPARKSWLRWRGPLSPLSPTFPVRRRN
jgi:hypothetical protein